MKLNDAHGMGEHFTWHWLTIHPSLFGFFEYEIGELDESQGLFVRVMESLGLERIAAEYHCTGAATAANRRAGCRSSSCS